MNSANPNLNDENLLLPLLYAMELAEESYDVDHWKFIQQKNR